MATVESVYRNELKYCLSEIQALAIRDRIMPFMEPDINGETYIVSSIYLDSPSLLLLHDGDVGKMNRYKLRLRTYGLTPKESLYLEIKARRNRMIRKYRAKVRTDILSSSFNSLNSDKDLLYNPENESDLNNFELFMMRHHQIKAKPVNMVRYNRSAYFGKDKNSLRITFDRNIGTYPVSSFNNDAWNNPSMERSLTTDQVILEIKSDEHLPVWLGEIIQDFQLQQLSYSKYVLCTKLLQREGAVLMESAI